MINVVGDGVFADSIDTLEDDDGVNILDVSAALALLQNSSRSHLNAGKAWRIATSGTADLSVYASLGGALADVVGITVVADPGAGFAMAVGDVLRVSFSGALIKTAAGNQAQLRLRSTSVSLGTIVMAGNANAAFSVTGAGNTATLIGYHGVGAVEAVTFQLQGAYSGGLIGVDILNSWAIDVVRLRGA